MLQMSNEDQVGLEPTMLLRAPESKSGVATISPLTYIVLAYREGLEPPTPGFGDPCSAIGATGINETGTRGRNRTFVIALSRRHSTIELHGQISECHVLIPTLEINLEFRVEVLHFSEQLVIIIIVQKAKLKKNLIVFCICVDELHTAPS